MIIGYDATYIGQEKTTVGYFREFKAEVCYTWNITKLIVSKISCVTTVFHV